MELKLSKITAIAREFPLSCESIQRIWECAIPIISSCQMTLGGTIVTRNAFISAHMFSCTLLCVLHALRLVNGTPQHIF